MMSGSRCSKRPVKVVIISTQYVETDATSFKSVVQKLTGKDSDVAAAAASVGKANYLETKAQREDQFSGGGSSFLMRDMSFKEFDKLMREMPPIHELWSD